MVEAVSHVKDPRKVAGGKARAAQRWSDPANRSVVRIADLTPPQRALVMALVAAAREQQSEPAA